MSTPDAVAGPTSDASLLSGSESAMVDQGLVVQFRQAVANRLADEMNALEAAGKEPWSFEDQRERTRVLVNDELDKYAQHQFDLGVDSRLPTELEEEQVAAAVLDALFGLGRLQPLIDDDEIENININGADNVWVKKVGGRKERAAPVANTDQELIDLVRHAAFHMAATERRFDQGSPQLDMRLPDGSRLSAVMGVASRPAVSIRRHRFMREDDARLDRLVELGAIDEELQRFLAAAVRARKTMVVAGGTNAGKTTMLRALANEIPPHERLVTIEKALELGLDQFPRLHPDVVALEAREANTEGEGSIKVSELVRRGLRMDPDRVIVGEVLGEEVIDMLNAMSQGNDGSLCTIHSNSSESVFQRICSYAIQSAERLPPEATNLLIAGAIDFVVFIDQVDERSEGGPLRRFVRSVREVIGVDGRDVLSTEVFRSPGSPATGPAKPCGTISCLADLERHGYRSGAQIASRRRGA